MKKFAQPPATKKFAAPPVTKVFGAGDEEPYISELPRDMGAVDMAGLDSLEAEADALERRNAGNKPVSTAAPPSRGNPFAAAGIKQADRARLDKVGRAEPFRQMAHKGVPAMVVQAKMQAAGFSASEAQAALAAPVDTDESNSDEEFLSDEGEGGDEEEGGEAADAAAAAAPAVDAQEEEEARQASLWKEGLAGRRRGVEAEWTAEGHVDVDVEVEVVEDGAGEDSEGSEDCEGSEGGSRADPRAVPMDLEVRSWTLKLVLTLHCVTLASTSCEALLVPSASFFLQRTDQPLPAHARRL
jgi:hypothetical protein